MSGKEDKGSCLEVLEERTKRRRKAGLVTGGESWDSSKGVLVCSGASSEMER